MFWYEMYEILTIFRLILLSSLLNLVLFPPAIESRVLAIFTSNYIVTWE